ncbi:MAG: Hsp20/alpha crystallin family protein [Candidatus Magasanikbacteria bacterium]|nr:Hsp20/alpha crystallin family protein [Candidatus Magasanikbacteria bacterium]
MLPRIWDPFVEMEEMMRNLPALGSNQVSLQKGFVPAMDVYDEKDAIVVETSLAGVSPKDISVSVENGVLTVQGMSKKEHEVEEKNYYRKEVRSGSFFRQMQLPTPVKENNVSAEFEDGVLKIRCPKASPGQSKKIPVEIKKKLNGNNKK